ncbi:MAG: hypothetical protein IKP38_07620 [Clostridia bacterium]|nr:hypothetical protein [Clostridia bacterium]
MKHLSKSAVLWLLIAVLFLLCACQPTPEEDVVVNKAEGALESAISGDSAEVYAIDSSDGTAETLRDALHVPETARLSVSGPVYGGTLHVEMDAAVNMPNVSKVPVMLVERYHPSAEQKQHIAETLTGETTFYETDPLGRERYLNVIEQYKQLLSVLKTHPYGENADYESLEKEYNEQIERLTTYYREGKPGTKQLWRGNWSDGQMHLCTERGETISINTESSDVYCIEYGATDATSSGDDAAIDAGTARKLLEDALEVIGNRYYEIVSICPADQGMRDRLGSTEGVDDGSFLITLRPVYAGIPVYNWNTYFGSDTAAQKAGVSYSYPALRERLHAEIRNGELIILEWIDPIEVLSVENENVSLLSFDEIMKIFEKQIFMNIYLDGTENTVIVTDVFFSYRCVPKRDSDQYYLLPVWDFVGYDTIFDTGKGVADTLYRGSGKIYKESLLTVNAIDGSILNEFLGY